MGRYIVAAFALLALLAASVAAAPGDFAFDYEFLANVNVSVNGNTLSALQLANGGLQFRSQPLLGGAFGKVGNTFFSSTLGLNVTLLGLPRIAADYELDIASLSSAGLPYALNAHWNASILTGSPVLNFDAALAANLIASFPYALVEIDENGADVAVHYIKDLTWRTLDTLTVKSVVKTIGAIGFTAEVENINGNSSFHLTLSLQTSVYAGVSNYLRYNVVPRAWVHAFNVTGYALQAAGNSLRLVQATATANTASGVTVNGGLITCPRGTSELLQAYAEVNATVIVDRSATAQAAVSAWAAVDSGLANTVLDSYAALKAQLNARFDSNWSLYFSNITYPKGKGECQSTQQSATGSRISEAQQAPIAPTSVPIADPTAAPNVPTGTPANPNAPTPSSASAVPVSFAVAIALLAFLGMLF